MLELPYEDFVIILFGDNEYTPGSVDNVNTYSHIYFNNAEDKYRPPAQHGIKILKGDKEISSCILIGEGGATGVHPNSAVVHANQLAVCCCNTIFCLQLPTLYLAWQVKADWATCFQIFILDGDYLVHGECDITRITTAGQIKWQFSGADIFVSMEGEQECELLDDRIVLRDFTGMKYVIDFDGKLLNS